MKKAYSKDFDNWNKEKKKLERRHPKSIICHNRQVWTCKIGENIGNEISKSKPFIRPIVIINDYLGGDLIGIVPFSTQYSEKLSRFIVDLEEYDFLNKTSYAYTNHFRSMSKKRLIKKLGKIDILDYQSIISVLPAIIKTPRRV